MVSIVRISVVVPSFKRLERLKECLKGIEGQTRAPDEVIVVWRDIDPVTGRWLATWAAEPSRYVRKMPKVQAPGQMLAMAAGLSEANGDVIAFVDDDAVPWADWLERLEGHYGNPVVGGIGGRDVVAGDTGPTVDTRLVGRLTWYGRISGNHHRGGGAPRNVSVLKGVNMSFRRNLARIPQCLRGDGAQVHNEVYCCLFVKSLGYQLIYDPAICVDHFPAQRHDANQRGMIVPTAVRDAAYNVTLSCLLWLPWYRRILRLAFGLLIGNRSEPGVLRFLLGVVQRDERVTRVFLASMTGQVQAVLSARRVRDDETEMSGYTNLRYIIEDPPKST